MEMLDAPGSAGATCKGGGGRSSENWSVRHPNRSIRGAFGAPELFDGAGLPGLDRAGWPGWPSWGMGWANGWVGRTRMACVNFCFKNLVNIHFH